MLGVIKTVLKAVSFAAGLCIFLALTLIPEGVEIAFSPITGLMEAYYKLENTALEIIPDEVEAVVERLANMLCRERPTAVATATPK